MLQKIKTFDFTLFFTPLALLAFGTVMIYSASMVYAPVALDLPSDHFLHKQFLWGGLGLFSMVLFAIIPYRHLQRLTKLIVLLMLLSLAGLFVFGIEVNNAQSWYDLGFMNFQPAEFVKLGLIIYLASVYARKQKYIENFSQAVVPPLILTSLILGMIVLQPDIGTAAIIGFIASMVVTSSGIRLRHIIVLVSITVSVLVLSATQLVTDERLSRFSGAFQPFNAPDDSGYHLIQSYVAIGTGGLTGEGLGHSVQKLGYLPEPHTDFIMAVIAEELGFLGVAIVIGLLSTIVLRGLFISKQCDNAFGSLLALGISSMIAIQSFINLGAMSGMLPITGVTLPFVSYGGSSLIILMTSMGILNNIARSVHVKEEQKTREKQPSSHSFNQVQRNREGERVWQN
ncbi:putative lipid II flippase FtsW [Thalassobacillus sp. CUG 92003]|uniref:putative lipid II flippase FtsW n=1 Tax=Thalassobacillus sp. CUG 92003 TaxID=2736641 RepID=UPI0015E72CBC|nr:putative lipid II flippase FtsW [Thalassobacillus sp. CUG 92003]